MIWTTIEEQVRFAPDKETRNRKPLHIKAHFSASLRSATRGPVVVTRSGRPVGVLLAIDDEEELERLVLAYSPRLRMLLDAARQRIRAGAGVRHEDKGQREHTAERFAHENRLRLAGAGEFATGAGRLVLTLG